MTVVWMERFSVAEQFTSTSPTDLDDLALTIEGPANISDPRKSYKLEWKIVFNYSNTNAAPRFDLTPVYGNTSQLYREWDQPLNGGDVGTFEFYYSGSSSPSAGEEQSGSVPYSAVPYPANSGNPKWYVLTMTLLIHETSVGIGNTSDIKPRIAVANSGDVARIIQGYGILTVL
jgi:hypothetical protein